MKLQSYISTPGLERYPKGERLAKWQAVYRQLLRDDVQCRKRFTSYLVTNLCLSCILLAVYGYYFGIGLSSLAANLSIIFCVTATMICVALRHLHFINQRVGRYLQSNYD